MFLQTSARSSWHKQKVAHNIFIWFQQEDILWGGENIIWREERKREAEKYMHTNVNV